MLCDDSLCIYYVYDICICDDEYDSFYMSCDVCSYFMLICHDDIMLGMIVIG